jgi:hypothetical protein
MYQKDYILRMIEMLVDLMAYILGLIKKGDFEKATHTLENAYYDFLKQDAAFFHRIPKEDLTNKLLKEHHFTNGHLEILSELFYAQAELFNAQDKKAKSVEYYEKSLILLDFIEKESKTFSVEKQSRISLIQDQIAKLNSLNLNK